MAVELLQNLSTNLVQERCALLVSYLLFNNELMCHHVTLDPASDHYYQPMWTLVGGGIKSLAQSGRPMKSVLPSKAKWLQDSVTKFEPTKNQLFTANGDVINYDWLVVATGLQLRYDKIKGLPEAFDTPGVGSNYSSKYVEKTHKAIKEFQVCKQNFNFHSFPEIL